MDAYQIILIVIGVIIAGLYIYERITGKSILRNNMLSRPVITAIGGAVEAVYKIWPDKKPLKIVYIIVQAAVEGAEIAEKAWQIGNIEKEDRNAFAKALVKDTLNKAGITITPQVEAIIAGIIEAVCIVLPHENKNTEEEEEEVTAIPVVRGD